MYMPELPPCTRRRGRWVFEVVPCVSSLASISASKTWADGVLIAALYSTHCYASGGGGVVCRIDDDCGGGVDNDGIL